MVLLLLAALSLPAVAAVPAGENEAVAAWREGRFEDALAAFRKALAALPAHHPAIPGVMGDIGELQRTLGRYREAERSQRRALDLRERALGPDHPDVASSLNNLAEALRAGGRPKPAEPYYRRALSILERSPRRDLAREAAVLGNLGQALSALRRPHEAEDALRRSLDLWERSGDRGPDSAIAANNLAVLLRERGRLDEAESLYRLVLATCERSLAPGHLNTALVLLNLADLARLRKRYAESQALFGKALPMLEARLGTEHPERAAALTLYAGLLRETGRGREARLATAESKEVRGRHARLDGSSLVIDARDAAR